MNHLAFFLVLAILGLNVAAQSPPDVASTTVNPMVDPFAVTPKMTLPPVPPPPTKLPAVPLPPAPLLPITKQPLPPGLRAILIRENGLGLLATGEAGALSITVINGKTVRIVEQDYRAEVDASEIRLYAVPNGKLAWQGSLAGSTGVAVPVDLSQVKYIPPLSAGVNPGLGSGGSPVSPITQPNQQSGAQ